jgi:hypothetical protein
MLLYKTSLQFTHEEYTTTLAMEHAAAKGFVANANVNAYAVDTFIANTANRDPRD